MERTYLFSGSSVLCFERFPDLIGHVELVSTATNTATSCDEHLLIDKHW